MQTEIFRLPPLKICVMKLVETGSAMTDDRLMIHVRSYLSSDDELQMVFLETRIGQIKI
jgi:hypothetical protein